MAWTNTLAYYESSLITDIKCFITLDPGYDTCQILDPYFMQTCIGLYYRAFYGRNSQIFVISQSACPWQAFPTQSFRCSTLGEAPALTAKHWTWLERLARDNHSSLLRKSVNYSRKKFYSIGPPGGGRRSHSAFSAHIS